MSDLYDEFNKDLYKLGKDGDSLYFASGDINPEKLSAGQVSDIFSTVGGGVQIQGDKNRIAFYDKTGAGIAYLQVTDATGASLSPLSTNSQTLVLGESGNNLYWDQIFVNAVNKIDLFCSGTTDVEVFLNANNGTISLYGSTTLFSAVGGTVGAVLDASSVSGSSKTFTFPNSSGTFALTSGVYSPGGTDVALADGGTGASLSDPNADRILFWDDSAGQVTWLTAGSGLTISGTTITASGGSGTVFVHATTQNLTTASNVTMVDATQGQVHQHADGVQSYEYYMVQVPTGKTSISSIKTWYIQGANTSTTLQLRFETTLIPTDGSAVTQDTNDTQTGYTSGATANRVAKITAPSAAYNAITAVAENDLLMFRVQREGGDAGDTYNGSWRVLGVEFTFA